MQVDKDLPPLLLGLKPETGVAADICAAGDIPVMWGDLCCCAGCTENLGREGKLRLAVEAEHQECLLAEVADTKLRKVGSGQRNACIQTAAVPERGA